MKTIEAIVNANLQKKRSIMNTFPKYRVSDAGRCHLMRYWKRLGKPITDPPDDRTVRVFEVGHVFHHWVQEILKDEGVLIGCEIKVEDEDRVGHIDAIVRMGENIVLYDFKTVHSRKFHHNRKEGWDNDLHYKLQASTYAIMCDIPVDEVRVAYISKDDLCIEEIGVPDHFKELAFDDWFSVIDAWKIMKEPLPNPKEWECRYCIYRSGCEHKRETKEKNQSL